MASAFESKAVDIFGGSLSFRFRAGSNGMILFLHGLGQSSNVFRAGFDEKFVSSSYSLLAPDLFGHGASIAPPGFSFSMKQHARSILELLSIIQSDKVVIVGHSMGSVIGMFVGQRLSNLAGFVSIEGNLQTEDCFLSSRIARMPEDTFVEKIFPHTSDAFSDSLGVQSNAQLAIGIHRSAISLVSSVQENDFLHIFESLRGVKAYVHGVRNSEAEVLAQLHGIETVMIDSESHSPMEDKPGATYGAIGSVIMQAML